METELSSDFLTMPEAAALATQICGFPVSRKRIRKLAEQGELGKPHVSPWNRHVKGMMFQVERSAVESWCREQVAECEALAKSVVEGARRGY